MSQFKPYPAYKDSGVEWLGDIPKDWVKGALKNIAWIRNGKDHKEVESPQGAYPVIGSGGQFSNADHYLYDGESVLLGRKGTIDKPLYINGRFWTVDTMFYTEVFKEASAKFLYYFALTIPFGFYSTSTALPSMTQGDLSNHPAAIPPKFEQIQIAHFLNYETARIDALIEEQKRLIELLKEKRQAVISHAVTKGLDPTVPMKDSGVEWLGEVPAHWKISPLKYHCTFSGGGTPSKENLDYWNGDIPWVSPKDMKRFWINDSQDKITMLGVSESSTSLVSSGAVLMVVRSGILQRTIPLGINSVEVSINQDMKALRFSVEELARYFTYLVIGFEPSWLLAWRKQGATVESIEQEYLSDSLIPIPSKNEANAIVEKLNWLSGQYDDLERESRESIRLLQERRSALISAAVTGKIDVRDWQPPTDSSAPSAAAQKTCLETV